MTALRLLLAAVAFPALACVANAASPVHGDPAATKDTARAAASPKTPEQPSPGLAPYQMVRSLQLVQDRIADGDHAALPMQNRLLGMIDERMRFAAIGEFDDPRNFNALLVYAMSGGNPKTIDLVLSKLTLDENGATIAAGLLYFLRGEPTAASARLGKIDPMTEPQAIGAFLALVKGSVLGSEGAQAALDLFDQARLLGSGTLVEEAALRRSMPIAVAMRDAPRFLNAASGYARRYLRSPYASEFAQAFVGGVIDLQSTIDMAAIDDIIGLMSREQQDAIYLRLARKGAIDGVPTLSAFAQTKVLKDRQSGEEDPRALLYAGMASINAGSIIDVAERLKSIDASRLSANDRQLLAAVEAVVAGVVATPQRQTASTKPTPENSTMPEPVKASEPEGAAPPDRLAEARTMLTEIDRLLESGDRQ